MFCGIFRYHACQASTKGQNLWENEELYMEEFIKEKKTVYKTRDPLGQSIEVCEGLYNEEHMRLLLVAMPVWYAVGAVPGSAASG